MEDENTHEKARKIFQKISEFRRRFQPWVGKLTDTSGHTVTEIKLRWKGYTKKLYSRDVNIQDILENTSYLQELQFQKKVKLDQYSAYYQIVKVPRKEESKF